MNGPRSSLDNLIVNTNSNPIGRRSFTREETFVLAWLVSNTEGRNYPNLMRECKLSLEQCRAAIQGLIELDLLRWR